MHRVGALFALLSVCFAQLHSTGSMQLYGCNASSPNQVYDYTAQQMFQGRFSGLCITASGSSGAQTLWPVTCEVGEPLQKFVVEVGGRIRLATTNLVLNVPGSRVYDFAEVALSPNSTVAPEANERFSYNTSTGLILGDESGLCVDAGTTAPLTFLATVFGEHMVLQRAPQAAVIWGFTTASATVLTTFNGSLYKSTAGPDGVWRQRLPPMPAGGVVCFLDTCDAIVRCSLPPANIGRCSGQSNMEFSVSALLNATEEAQRANAYPNIRLFTVGQGTQSVTPLLNLNTIEEPWSVAQNTTVSFGGEWGYFSAVCWLFGRDLFDGLGGSVPIGLVSSNWGGTEIEIWAPPAAYPPCNRTPEVPVLWNAMINPFTVGPMALTGFAWYQGEANAGPQPRASNYACFFPSVIESWRAAFENADAYFGFVQLSTWCFGPDMQAVPEMRQAQLAATTLSNVGYAVNADHGAGCSIHPPAKQFCSSRLANSALASIYSQPIRWKSPSYASAFAPSVDNVVTIALNDVPSSGLELRVSANIGTLNCSSNPGVCGWATIQYDVGNAVNATAGISSDGQSITLTATPPTGAKRVIATTYAWADVPFMTVYTMGYDLPVLAWNATF